MTVETYEYNKNGIDTLKEEALAEKTNITQASHAAMPPSTLQELSFPANSGTYTALSDGYFFLNAYSQSTSWASLCMIHQPGGFGTQSVCTGSAGSGLAVFLPVKKGQVIWVEAINVGNWTQSGTNAVKRFAFVPTVGAAGEV